MDRTARSTLRRNHRGQPGLTVKTLIRYLDKIEPPAEGDWDLDAKEAGDDDA